MESVELFGRRTEQAIYTVGGVVLLLFGFQSLASTTVDIYTGAVRSVLPGPADPFWIAIDIELTIGVLFVIGASFLLIMAFNARHPSSSAAPVVTPPGPFGGTHL